MNGAGLFGEIIWKGGKGMRKLVLLLLSLGEDYTFGMTVVNRVGVEGDIVEGTIHIPLPKPEAPQSFEVEV